MKIKRAERKEWQYRVLFIANILLVIMIVFLTYMGGFFSRVLPFKCGGGYSYLDNSQYLAGVSMYDITEREDAKIIFAGDSLTARGNFEEFFDERDIINRGIGSDISEGLYNRIDQIILLKPKKVFIMIGINDISEDILLEDTLYYVSEICKAIKKSNSDTEIYIQSVLPTVSGDIKQKKKIIELNQEYSILCDMDEKMFFVDLYTLFLNDKNEVNSELYSPDGVHLNGNGYKVWVDSISEFINY